ncbi:MAG TPA: heparan-alpha-glucosaminide N-acetyltransferase domain-containing protein [Mycobacteriales bacterium]|nr:heparan-alpha-glucosaminide N-acetyltransferase domain-containing protein [Mycobacteriales bacterium]
MTSSRPAGSVPRILGVDAARGVALVGMMAVHVLPGADARGNQTPLHEVFGGRAAATFAVLAGVGLALMTRRARDGDDDRGRSSEVASVLVRALLIGAVGLALGDRRSGVAVILAYYALLFVLAIPLLRLRRGSLVAVAVGVALLGPFVSYLLRGDQGLPFGGANPTFDIAVESPLGLIWGLGLLGYYPAFIWLAYVCTGLAAGRLALVERRTAGGLLVGGAVLATVGAAASAMLLGPLDGRSEIAARASAEQLRALDQGHSMFGNTPTDTWWWLAVDAPHSSTPPDLVHTAGTALAVLGALLLLERYAGRLLLPLAAAGSMTLTLYTLHVWLLSTGWLPDDRETSYTVQVAGALVLATLWRHWFRRGPLEAVVARASSAAGRAVG